MDVVRQIYESLPESYPNAGFSKESTGRGNSVAVGRSPRHAG